MNAENTVTRTIELDTSNIQEQVRIVQAKLYQLEKLVKEINDIKIEVKVSKREGKKQRWWQVFKKQAPKEHPFDVMFKPYLDMGFVTQETYHRMKVYYDAVQCGLLPQSPSQKEEDNDL